MQMFEERLRGCKVVDNLETDFERIIKHSTLNQWLVLRVNLGNWTSPLVS